MPRVVDPTCENFSKIRSCSPDEDTCSPGCLCQAATFEEARSLLFMYGKAGPGWDPISFSRGSVSSRTPDFLHNGFSVLIDAGADVLKWANEHQPKLASTLIGQWIESDAPILKYGASSKKIRAEFLAQAEAAMNPAGKDYERSEFFNLLSWLRARAPKCIADRTCRLLAPRSQRKIDQPAFSDGLGNG